MEQVIYQDGVFKVIGNTPAPQTTTAPATPMPAQENKPMCRQFMENKLKIQKWEKATWILATGVMILAALTFWKFLAKD